MPFVPWITNHIGTEIDNTSLVDFFLLYTLTLSPSNNIPLRLYDPFLFVIWTKQFTTNLLRVVSVGETIQKIEISHGSDKQNFFWQKKRLFYIEQ